MSQCENRTAFHYAFPPNSSAVNGRSMTLEIQCREPAEYSTTVVGVGSGRARAGAEHGTFALCVNHSQLMEQMDREMVDEGWTKSLVARPTRIA